MKKRKLVSVILLVCLLFSTFSQQLLTAYAGDDVETGAENETDIIRTGIGLEEGYEDDNDRSVDIEEQDIDKAFTKRTTAPSTSDERYYGSGNPYPSKGANCTWYAYGRAWEIMGYKPPVWQGNACDWWYYNDGFERGSEPRLGAMMCWGSSTGYGHVAIVEDIGSDGKITYSESSYEPAYTFKLQTMSPSSLSGARGNFQGYIYIPGSVDPTPPILEKGAGQQIPDGDYRIVTGISSWDTANQLEWSGLDVYGYDIPCASGTNVQIYKNFDNEMGLFTVTYLDNGFYKITQKGTNMALEVASGYSEANVRMGTYSNNKYQQMWSIQPQTDLDGRGTGWYSLQCKYGCCVLDVVGGDNAAPDNLKNVQTYPWNNTKNQKWKFIPISTDTVEEGDYHIISGLDSSMGLGVSTGSETNPDYPNAVLTNDRISDDTVYTVEKHGNLYYIKQKSTGYLLDIEGGGSLKNAGFWPKVVEGEVASQTWSIKSDGEGAYYIMSRYNGAVLDVVNGLTNEKQNIWMHWCNFMPAQKWSFLKAVTGISLDQNTLELAVGGSETLNPIFTPSDAGYKHTMWDSSDPAVATVDQNGKVTAVALGTAVITATSLDGGYSAECTVTVSKKVTPKTYTVTFDANGKTAKNMPKAQTVEKGKTATKPATDPKAEGFKFAGWYAEASGETAFDFTTPINEDTTVYAKWLDEKADIVTVTFDLNGRSGKAPEAQKIEKGQKAARPANDPSAFGYRFTDWYKEAACTNKYDFTAPVTENITVYAGWEKLDVPDNGVSALDPKPVITDDTNAIYLVKGQKFNIGQDWISSDKKILSISKKGVAMAKKVTGSPVKIKKGTKEIDVYVIKPEITKSMTLEAGATKQITIIYDSENMPVYWYSAAPDVATVDQEGNVTAVAKGSAKITAYINGSAYNCTVKVTEKDVVPKNRTLHLVTGQSKTVKLTGLKNYDWKSDDETVVSVKKNKFTANAVGTAEVTATVGEDTYTVTVYVENITVNGAEAAKGKNKYNLELTAGGSEDPVAMIGFDESMEQAVVFKSNKPDIAFIDEDGYVYARSKGKAKFTTRINGKTITVTVNVK